jgi:hypothetical protein
MMVNRNAKIVALEEALLGVPTPLEWIFSWNSLARFSIGSYYSPGKALFLLELAPSHRPTL